MNPLDIYTLALYALIFCFGACMGSYLNVVAYRLPLGLSTIYPSSHCPNCKTPVAVVALIPIVGFFWEQGQCRACKEKISKIYPLVETLTGLATCAMILCLQGHPTRFFAQIFDLNSYFNRGNDLGTIRVVIAGLWLLYTAIPLSIIDIRFRILPDRITLPGCVVGFGLGSILPGLGPVGSAVGILVGGGGLYAISKFYELVRKREGMGMGDVKYLAMIGAVVGWEGVIHVIALSSLLGALVGITISIYNKSSVLTGEIPFGPFLALSAICVFVYQHFYYL